MFLKKIQNYIEKESTKKILEIENLHADIYNFSKKLPYNNHFLYFSKFRRSLNKHFKDKKRSFIYLLKEDLNIMKKYYLSEYRDTITENIKINNLMDVTLLDGKYEEELIISNKIKMEYSFNIDNLNILRFSKEEDSFYYHNKNLELEIIGPIKLKDKDNFCLIFNVYKYKRKFIFFEKKYKPKRYYIRDGFKSNLNENIINFIFNNLNEKLPEIENQLMIMYDITLFEVEKKLIVDLKYLNKKIS